jgi:hypothetical protein
MKLRASFDVRSGWCRVDEVNVRSRKAALVLRKLLQPIWRKLNPVWTRYIRIEILR